MCRESPRAVRRLLATARSAQKFQDSRARWDGTGRESAWVTIAVQLGFVTGALGSAITNLPDRFSARHVVFVSSLAAASANGGLLLADGPGAALALRFVTGFFVAGIYPPVMILVPGPALGVLAMLRLARRPEAARIAGGRG